MQTEARQLKDLISVGPALLKDFDLLGVRTVAQLRTRSPERMYRRLCTLKKQRVDPCCLDVFVAAVAQARNPELAIEQCQWWFWSRVRKGKGRPGVSRERTQLRIEITTVDSPPASAHRQLPAQLR